MFYTGLTFTVQSVTDVKSFLREALQKTIYKSEPNDFRLIEQRHIPRVVNLGTTTKLC